MTLYIPVGAIFFCRNSVRALRSPARKRELEQQTCDERMIDDLALYPWTRSHNALHTRVYHFLLS